MPGKIPAFVLDNARGIAVIPSELKGGFIFGAELGSGVVVRRLADGSWSPPALISLAGGSSGLQIGGEARDLVLVFNSDRTMSNIENGKLTLGGDVSIAAGPVGQDVGVTTETPEVYSYVRSHGAFIGATVGGSVLSLDYDANRALYGVTDPLGMMPVSVPEPARRFSCAVASATGAPAKVCG